MEVISLSQGTGVTPLTSGDFEMAQAVGTFALNRKQTISDTQMRTLHGMFSRYSNGGLNSRWNLDNFNRFYQIYPDMEMPVDLKSYIFMTRPDMNLLKDGAGLNVDTYTALVAENSNDSRLQYLYSMNPELVKMLTASYSDDHDFIPYIQGRAESLQLPDYEIATSDFSIPFFSYKYSYPTVTNESITGGQFELTLREDDDLRITKMFNFWIYYMDAISKNKMKPAKTMIYNGFYDFMCSVYEIICDPTSQRILYWAKYTGCYPVSVPNSNFSHNLRSNVENRIGIRFNYMMVESLEPRVIIDFNRNAKANTYKASNAVPLYDTDFGMVGESLVGAPLIALSSDQHSLGLLWTPKKQGPSSSSPTSALSNIDRALKRAAIYQNALSQYSASVASSSSSNNLSNYLMSNSDSIR